jgi:hypothetical protein
MFMFTNFFTQTFGCVQSEKCKIIGTFNTKKGIGIKPVIGIPASDISVRYRTRFLLFRYRTGSGICLLFQSGTGLAGCLTVRHLQKLYWVRWKGVQHPARARPLCLSWRHPARPHGWWWIGIHPARPYMAGVVVATCLAMLTNHK